MFWYYPFSPPLPPSVSEKLHALGANKPKTDMQQRDKKNGMEEKKMIAFLLKKLIIVLYSLW